jgi:hypothetical protein
MPPPQGAFPCERRFGLARTGPIVRTSAQPLRSSEGGGTGNSLVDGRRPLAIFMQPDSLPLVDQSSADPNFTAPLLSKFETSLA